MGVLRTYHIIVLSVSLFLVFSCFGGAFSPVLASGKNNNSSLIYKVKKGDTLFGIARKYNVSVNDIMSLNRLSEKDELKAGAKLKIPREDQKKTADPAESKLKKKTAENSRDVSGAKFKWPVKKVVGYQRDEAEGVKPLGIVIKCDPGATVFPARSGVVRKVGYMRGFGQYVVLKHDGNFATVYSNLEKISVSEGDELGISSVIGKMNRNSTLHFQIDYAGKPENPLKYLR